MKLTTSILIAASLATASSNCCKSIEHFLPSLVDYPGSSSYNATEASYWSLQESDLQPACIVHPTTVQHVSRIMGVIKRNSRCKFAIKGQGHSPLAGFANVQDGVTIDMTGLADMSLSADQSILQVAAGLKWLDVYRYLEPFSLAVAGGRNGLVGVAGLLIGGGISHFTTKVGWACDNVVNYQVVLANGQIVEANANHHRTLFRALCGGANNFGIVTRFDLKTFSQPGISVTSLTNDISQRQRVFGAFTDLINAPTFDKDVSLVTGLLFNSTSKSWILTNSAVYAKPIEKPPVFNSLSSIPNVKNTTSITTLAKFADEKATPPLNWYFATTTLKPSQEFMMEVFDVLNTTLYSFNPAGGVVWNFALEPLAGNMLTTGETLGMKVSEKGYIVLMSALWPNSASRQSIDAVANQALQAVEDAARSKGLLQNFQYLNYAAAYQKPLESYGHDNLDQLRAVGRAYDWRRVFQRQLNGGFKLY